MPQSILVDFGLVIVWITDQRFDPSGLCFRWQAHHKRCQQWTCQWSPTPAINANKTGRTKADVLPGSKVVAKWVPTFVLFVASLTDVFV